MAEFILSRKGGAMTDTPKPQRGIWKLTAPDGRVWRGWSPLNVVAKEQRERVPKQVAIERVLTALTDMSFEELKSKSVEPDPEILALAEDLVKDAEDDLCLYHIEHDSNPLYEDCGKNYPLESCGKECDGWTPVPS